RCSSGRSSHTMRCRPTTASPTRPANTSRKPQIMPIRAIETRMVNRSREVITVTPGGLVADKLGTLRRLDLSGGTLRPRGSQNPPRTTPPTPPRRTPHTRRTRISGLLVEQQRENTDQRANTRPQPRERVLRQKHHIRKNVHLQLLKARGAQKKGGRWAQLEGDRPPPPCGVG